MSIGGGSGDGICDYDDDGGGGVNGNEDTNGGGVSDDDVDDDDWSAVDGDDDSGHICSDPADGVQQSTKSRSPINDDSEWCSGHVSKPICTTQCRQPALQSATSGIC